MITKAILFAAGFLAFPGIAYAQQENPAKAPAYFSINDSKPVFPATLQIGNVTVLLNADGTATGDGKAFREALSQMKGYMDRGSLIAAWAIARTLP